MAWQPKPAQWFVIAIAFVLAFVVVSDAILIGKALAQAVFILLGAALVVWFIDGGANRGPLAAPEILYRYTRLDRCEVICWLLPDWRECSLVWHLDGRMKDFRMFARVADARRWAREHASPIR